MTNHTFEQRAWEIVNKQYASQVDLVSAIRDALQDAWAESEKETSEAWAKATGHYPSK